jgi:hypothetical protein
VSGFVEYKPSTFPGDFVATEPRPKTTTELMQEASDRYLGLQPRQLPMHTAAPVTGSIGPVRRNLLGEAKAYLGDLMTTAGQNLDLANGLLTSGIRAATGATGVIDPARRSVLDTQTPTRPLPAPAPVGRWSGLQSGGEGMTDSANGLPLIRADHGLMSLKVDPRAVDAAAWLAPPATYLTKAAGLGLLDAAKGFIDDAARAGMSQIWQGPKSRTWDSAKGKDYLRLEDAERADLDTSHAWRTTGTARVKDGSLIQEINDSTAALLTDHAYERPFKEVIQHDPLVAAYPELFDEVKVSLTIDKQLKTRGHGSYDSDAKLIKITAPNMDEARRIAIHEANHAVSRFEGRATGGSPDRAGKMVAAALENPNTTPEQRAKLLQYNYRDYDAYQALQDEVLSRAAEARRDMLPIDSARVEPSRDFDVDPQDWIVSRENAPGISMADGGGGTSSAEHLFGKEGEGWVPDNGNVGYLGFTRDMTPGEFLGKAEDITGNERKGSLEYLRSHVQGGGKLGNPFLSPRWDEQERVWRVRPRQHEGRHRMTVVREMLGPDARVPVHIFPREGLRARDITDEMRRAPILLEGQPLPPKLGPVSDAGKAAAKDMPPFDDLMTMARQVNAETVAARAPSSLLPEPTPAAAPAGDTTLNIGMNVNDGSVLTEKEILQALKGVGVKVRRKEIRQSGTEPTVIAQLDRPLTPQEAHDLSAKLRQDAIAQRVGTEGALHGPAAEKWGPFNPEYFLDLPPPKGKVSSLKSAKRKQVEAAAREAGVAVKRDDLKDSSRVVSDRKKEARSLLSVAPRTLDQEALRESSLVDRSLIDQALEGHPGIPQVAIERDMPKTKKSVAESSNRVRTIFGGDNLDLIKQQVLRGMDMGGATYYPSTYPLRARAAEIGADFERVAAGNAGTSAQNKLPNNFASDSVVRYAERRGITDPVEVKRFADGIAEKFGHQKFFLSPSHTNSYYDLLSGRATGFDKSQKITGYHQNLRGNFEPNAIDTHEVSGLSAGTSLFPYYSRMGSLSSTEYGVMELAYREKLAASLGLRPANAQAGRWYGGGDLTGLFTDPGDFLSTLEHMIQFTAESRGLDTSRKGLQKLLDDYLLGDATLVPWYSKGLPKLKNKKGGGFVDPMLAASITGAVAAGLAAPAVLKEKK